MALLPFASTKKKKFVALIVLIACVLVVLSVAFILLQQARAKQPTKENISSAVARAAGFLNGIYDKQFLFDDDYINCFGKDYAAPCGDEFVFYRQLDAAMDVLLLEKEGGVSLNQKVSSQADALARGTLNNISSSRIDYSYNGGDNAAGDYALDSTCMLSLIYDEPAVFDKIRSAYTPTGWFNDSADYFRKTVDETWCAQVLARRGLLEENKVFLKYNAARVENYAKTSDRCDRRAYALMHFVLASSEARANGLDDAEVNADEKKFSKQLEEMSGEECFGLAEVSCNSLYALAKSGYSNKDFLKRLAEIVLEKQSSEGYWTNFGGNATKNAWAMITMRCAIALNEYAKRELS